MRAIAGEREVREVEVNACTRCIGRGEDSVNTARNKRATVHARQRTMCAKNGRMQFLLILPMELERAIPEDGV